MDHLFFAQDDVGGPPGPPTPPITVPPEAYPSHSTRLIAIPLEAYPSPSASPIAVPPEEYPSHSYWQEQGWRLNRPGRILHGYYRTFRGSFRGVIELSDDPEGYKFFILNPPAQLHNHPHAICFCHQGYGKYLAHFTTPHKNIDAGIIKIEQVLREALELY